MGETPTCATCRFQRLGRSSGGIECHRFPLAVIRSAYSRQVWPMPEPSDWCGEHAPSPSTPGEQS